MPSLTASTGRSELDRGGRHRPPSALAYAWAPLTIALLAAAASATSLPNRFALDDRPIIAHDSRIHRLDAPWRFFTQTYWPLPLRGTLYRPLASLAFAVEWRVGGGAPWPYHAVNVLLYVGICLLEWSTWGRLRMMRRVDSAAFLSTAVCTLLTNAIVAVAVGCAMYGIQWLHDRYLSPNTGLGPLSTAKASD